MISPFIVKFDQLSLGKHEFAFKVDKTLFEGNGNEDVLDASFDIKLELYKTGNVMDMKFLYSGDFILSCDRCNDAVTIPVKEESELIAKFGQLEHENLGELIVLEDHEFEIDLGPYIYESLSLVIPVRHIHEEKDCNPEILKKLKGIEEENTSDYTDPRWQKLKEL